MISDIAKYVFREIFSLRNISDNNGTKIYPKASIIGRSLSLTPWCIAVMLTISVPKNIIYADTTLQFINSSNGLLYVLTALFFKMICEHAEIKTANTTAKYQNVSPSMPMCLILQL